MEKEDTFENGGAMPVGSRKALKRGIGSRGM